MYVPDNLIIWKILGLYFKSSNLNPYNYRTSWTSIIVPLFAHLHTWIHSSMLNKLFWNKSKCNNKSNCYMIDKIRFWNFKCSVRGQGVLWSCFNCFKMSCISRNASHLSNCGAIKVVTCQIISSLLANQRARINLRAYFLILLRKWFRVSHTCTAHFQKGLIVCSSCQLFGVFNLN